MDITLKRLLGLEEEGKRQYRFVSGEVTREEFEYCQLLDALVFGDGGYVQTLGPTWSLIHDPRFVKIENAFIINRKAIFGGDAMVGKQYISSDGTFTSTIADLEQYAETLGEGRYFYTIIKHPNKKCPLRNWYLRIFPDMVHKDGLEIPTASSELQCECDYNQPDLHTVKDWSDEQLWALIREECSNYFGKPFTVEGESQPGKPNGLATRLFDLFRADLLGLIADYAVTPISDVYIELDTGDIMAQRTYTEENGTLPHVFLEVDILERALTQRAVLRATAAKILRQIGFQKVIRDELGDIRLTDFERDTLLRLIYEPKDLADSTPREDGVTVKLDIPVDPGSNWFGFLKAVKEQVTTFLRDIKNEGRTFEERQQEQLSHAVSAAHVTFAKLETGEQQIINQFTEPEVDVPLDAHAQIMQEILKNPIKQELFMMWVEAERRSEPTVEEHEIGSPEWLTSSVVDVDRLNMRKLHSILTPIFTDPNFVVDEAKFGEYMAEAENLGLFSVSNVTEVEGDYGDYDG